MKKVAMGVVAVMSLWLMACSTPKKPIQMVIEKPVQIMRVMAVNAPTVVSQIQVLNDIPKDFDNSSWQILQVRGQRLASDSFTPMLTFKSGELLGFTGCKQITGTYQRQGFELWVTGFVMDNETCAAIASQQQLVEWLLMQVRQVRIIQSNGYLALLDDYQNLLAELKPVNQVP